MDDMTRALPARLGSLNVRGTTRSGAKTPPFIANSHTQKDDCADDFGYSAQTSSETCTQAPTLTNHRASEIRALPTRKTHMATRIETTAD